MKCKKCKRKFKATFDNMMIFPYTTIFNCPYCTVEHKEVEIEEEEEEIESE